jgi:hypothetical protein
MSRASAGKDDDKYIKLLFPFTFGTLYIKYLERAYVEQIQNGYN